MAHWRRDTWWEVAASVLALGSRTRSGPVLLAVDGRSGAGKSTAAQRLRAEVPGAAVVHTDDVAWYESFFGWDHLLAAHVLLPLRRGVDVDFRPASWAERGREGSIRVAAAAPLVIVEGVGSSRRSLTTLLDGSVWVQSDEQESRRRGIDRDGGDADAVAFWDEWGRAEERFLAADRPWERAWATLCGTPALVVGEALDDDVVLVAARGAYGRVGADGPSCRC